MNQSEDRPLALVPDPQYIQRLFPKCPPIAKNQQNNNSNSKQNNKKSSCKKGKNINNNTNNSINNNSSIININQANKTKNSDQTSSQKKTRKQHTRRQREAKRNLSKEPHQLTENNSTTINNITGQPNIAKKVPLHLNLKRLNEKPSVSENADSSDEDAKEKKPISGKDGATADIGSRIPPSQRRLERNKSSSASRRRRNPNSSLLMPAICETQLEAGTNNIADETNIHTNNSTNNHINHDNIANVTTNNETNNIRINDDVYLKSEYDPKEESSHDVGDDELICNMLADDLRNKVDLATSNQDLNPSTMKESEPFQQPPTIINDHRECNSSVMNNDLQINNNNPDDDSRVSLVEVVQIDSADMPSADLQQNNNLNLNTGNNCSEQSTTMHKLPNETSHFSLVNHVSTTEALETTNMENPHQQLLTEVNVNGTRLDKTCPPQNFPSPFKLPSSEPNLTSLGITPTDPDGNRVNDYELDCEGTKDAAPDNATNATMLDRATEAHNSSASMQVGEQFNECDSTTTIRKKNMISLGDHEESSNNAHVISAQTELAPTRSTSSFMQFNSLSDDDLDLHEDINNNLKDPTIPISPPTTLIVGSPLKSLKNRSDLVPIQVSKSGEFDGTNDNHDNRDLSAQNNGNKSNQADMGSLIIDIDETKSTVESSAHQQQLERPFKSSLINYGEREMSPPATIKTAFIFPRLDEGLSSNPDSCEEDVEEEDERAMDADVDADEDEYDDDDDDDADGEDDDDDDDEDDERDDDQDDEDDEDDDDDDDDDDADEDILPALERGNQAQLASHQQQQSTYDSLFNRSSQQTKSRSQIIQDNGLASMGGTRNQNSYDNPQQQLSNHQSQLGMGMQNGKLPTNYATGGINPYSSLDQGQDGISDNASELAKSLDTAYSNGSLGGNNNYWSMNNQQSSSAINNQQANSPFGNRLATSNNNNLNQSNNNLSEQNGIRQQFNTNTSNINTNNPRSSQKSSNNNYNRDEAKGANRFSSDTDNETDRLLGNQRSDQQQQFYKQNNNVNQAIGGGNNNASISPSSMVNPSIDSRGNHNSMTMTDNSMQIAQANQSKGSNSREVLIEGVLYNVKYLGSTHSDYESPSEKETRINQAEMAVREVKYRNGDSQQPPIEVQLFISTEKIMVFDDKNRKIMMDHSLKTISYIADIGDAIVLIARKRIPTALGLNTDNGLDQSSIAANNLDNQLSMSNNRPISKESYHVFESRDSHKITKSISQAFHVAFNDYKKAKGITDDYLPKELDYQDVLNSQEMSTDELEMFARKENQREVIVPKDEGEILGVSIVESGWGSILPTVVIASLKQNGPAERCKKLSIGDQILSVNGISLVGLPLNECQEIIKRAKNQRVARLSVVPCPITVEVKIKRPDTKYQLGFSVQNGVICSLLRGGIAERGGVRVGHRIMSINGTTVVGVPHEKIVTLLASSVGEIRMKTCLTSLYRLILGEDNPVHL